MVQCRLCSEPRRAPAAFLGENSRRGEFFLGGRLGRAFLDASPELQLGSDGAWLRWPSGYSVDPISYRGGVNLYAYCGDDPLSYVDPLGTKIVQVSTYFGLPLPLWGGLHVDAAVDDATCTLQSSSSYFTGFVGIGGSWGGLNAAAGVTASVTAGAAWSEWDVLDANKCPVIHCKQCEVKVFVTFVGNYFLFPVKMREDEETLVVPGTTKCKRVDGK